MGVDFGRFERAEEVPPPGRTDWAAVLCDFMNSGARAASCDMGTPKRAQNAARSLRGAAGVDLGRAVSVTTRGPVLWIGRVKR